MAAFTSEEIIQATGARLLKPAASVSFSDVCTDTRAIAKGSLFVAFKGTSFNGHDFVDKALAAGAAGAVVSEVRPEYEGMTAPIFVAADTLKAYQDLARFHRRRFAIPVVAVTGSVGKTSTRNMIATVLSEKHRVLQTEKNFNNEIGLPKTLLQLTPDHEACVVEMGMRGLGQIVELTAIELAPEGTGYRARTRFAKFFNLPELMAMFKEAADIKTSDQLNLPVPQAKFETVVVKPSEIQQDMVQALSERAAEVHSGSVDPSVDNMLKITSDGRKIGLDQRLMNSALPDDPSSKLNACVNNVLRIWNDTKEQKLTQLIFCDMSTPKGDGSFNVYDDIRSKLLTAGVPEQEIEFIHNADTENKKAELFSKVRSGQVRVLLGSTAKMGAGTNVQTLLVAVHHLDVGWRPSDMTQRNGRIIRQGNQNKQVYVYNYVTESTFDAYLYQTLENKQKFISQIMTSKSPMRSCDDIDEQAFILRRNQGSVCRRPSHPGKDGLGRAGSKIEGAARRLPESEISSGG